MKQSLFELETTSILVGIIELAFKQAKGVTEDLSAVLSNQQNSMSEISSAIHGRVLILITISSQLNFIKGMLSNCEAVKDESINKILDIAIETVSTAQDMLKDVLETMGSNLENLIKSNNALDQELKKLNIKKSK